MTTILIVEDHEALWETLSRRLRRHGFEVRLAHDGQQALDRARSERPDVMLLDMDLPVMDGWTVARKLRADPDAPKLPIIALTAHAMAGDRAKALEAGCDEYHPKPVDLPRLLTQIDEMLLKYEDDDLA